MICCINHSLHSSLFTDLQSVLCHSLVQLLFFFFKSMLSQTCVHLWLIFRRKVSTLLDWIIEFMVHFEAKYFDYLRYLPIFSRLFITFWFNFLRNQFSVKPTSIFDSFLDETFRLFWSFANWIVEFMVNFVVKYFDYLRYLPIFSRFFITFWFNF